MPDYHFILENIDSPCGYTLNSALENEKVKVVSRGFSSYEDGESFYDMLEGTFNNYLKTPSGEFIPSSVISSMLLIYHSNKTLEVYIGVGMIITAQAKKNLVAGDAVLVDDIGDISKLELTDIEIPKDSNFALLFSSGWRKAVYFDFSILNLQSELRDYDTSEVLGRYYNYLCHRQYFSISADQWDCLFQNKMFPFTILPKSDLKMLVEYCVNRWPIESFFKNSKDSIIRVIENNLKDITNSNLERHSYFIKQALDRFKAEDYMSCISIIYPRIEGIMRDILVSIEPDTKKAKKAHQNDQSNVFQEMVNSNSILLPKKFSEYIQNVYFKFFDTDKQVELSRNSLAHGVAHEREFNIITSSLGLLIIAQIKYFMAFKK